MAIAKYGFIGLGMGGSSIAHACASIRMNAKNNYNPYSALLINTNDIDLRKLSDRPNITKFLLRGYERGAARDISIGEKAFLQYKDEITQQVENIFTDRDFLFLVCGLGGGTGTGSVIEAARLLHANGFAGRFGLILTLPRNQEGFTVLDNAIQRLQIISKAMKGLGGILLVDNQKLFSAYLREHSEGQVSAFLEQSNKFIADTLHELNIVTTQYNPLSGYHFDSSELIKLFQTSGVFTIGKCEIEERNIDTNNQGTYMHIFKKSIEDGMLSDGYSFDTATRVAVSMVASSQGSKRIFSLSMVNAIEEQLLKYTPYAIERPVATYADGMTKNLKFYSVFAGLSLPKRVIDIVENIKKSQRPEAQDQIANALQDYRGSNNESSVDLESFFKKEDNPITSDKEDPFNFL